VADVYELYQKIYSNFKNLFKFNAESLEKALSNKKNLAQGGFANVYSIDYNNETYAVKVIETNKFDEALQSLSEIMNLCQVACEYVVQLYWLWMRKINNDQTFQINLVMSHLDMTLENIIINQKGIRFAQKLEMFERLISGLVHFENFTNDLYVIHADIKPKNILVTQYYKKNKVYHKVYYADFGIAHILTKNTASSEIIYLTDEYSSPEQYHDHIVSSKSDLYSVGVIGLELFTGSLKAEQKINIKKGLESLDAFWKPCISKRSFKKRVRSVLDIIKLMLKYTPAERISASECLAKIKLLNTGK
jgi:serine/threonine protein kinase